MPPRTGRRYIVVGGGGFLGGWVVTKLLERGENPHHIRILNTSPPVRNYVVKDSLSTGVQFIKVDMTDAAALQAAFKAPWPKSTSSTDDTEPEITVFHTAAKMLFYERHLEFLYRSAKVNVRGTQNVVDAARAVGATILVYTSSGGVGVHRTRLFLWPWETEPERFVQIINETTPLPKRHEEFPSNYSVTKMEADRLVRAADRSSTGPPGGKGGKNSSDGVYTSWKWDFWATRGSVVHYIPRAKAEPLMDLFGCSLVFLCRELCLCAPVLRGTARRPPCWKHESGYWWSDILHYRPREAAHVRGHTYHSRDAHGRRVSIPLAIADDHAHHCALRGNVLSLASQNGFFRLELRKEAPRNNWPFRLPPARCVCDGFRSRHLRRFTCSVAS